MDVQLDLFEPQPRPSLRPGQWVAWWRRDLGRCVGRVRRVFPAGVTADRLEVLKDERARGHSRPRTKPHFITESERVTPISDPGFGV